MTDIDLKSIFIGIFLTLTFIYFPNISEITCNFQFTNFKKYINFKYLDNDNFDHIECQCMLYFIDPEELKGCNFCISQYKKKIEIENQKKKENFKNFIFYLISFLTIVYFISCFYEMKLI